MSGRHDRSYGRYEQPGRKGGKQRSAPATHAMRVAEMGRKDGASKPSGSPAPQKPKGAPKPKPTPKDK